MYSYFNFNFNFHCYFYLRFNYDLPVRSAIQIFPILLIAPLFTSYKSLCSSSFLSLTINHFFLSFLPWLLEHRGSPGRHSTGCVTLLPESCNCQGHPTSHTLSLCLPFTSVHCSFIFLSLHFTSLQFTVPSSLLSFTPLHSLSIFNFSCHSYSSLVILLSAPLIHPCQVSDC